MFSTQGSNPGLLDCRQILYQLSHKGSPTNLVICCLFDNSHSNRGEVISHCGFDSLMANGVENLLMDLLAIHMSSLEKRLCSSSARFLIGLFVSLMLSCMNSLYILDINSLFRYIVCKYLLPFSKWSFPFVESFFAVQKLFFLNRNIHNNFILNSPEVETTPKSTN